MPRILIVDDEDSVRKVLRYRLKDSYEIVDTGHPEEALALALQHKPDAILLDLNMPNYSGFELCQTLSSMSFTQLIPILIVSGESAARYRDYCENLGAKGYVQKPIDFEALETWLRKVLGVARRERRSEPRVRLRVMLKIRGSNAQGEPFEFLSATENVSAHGFLCNCTASLRKDDIVEVFLMASDQQLAGKARLIRLEWPDSPGQRCGFQFVTEPHEWVLR